MLLCSRNLHGLSTNFDEMMSATVIDISKGLFTNFQDLRSESIVFTVGEILRGLISNKVSI